MLMQQCYSQFEIRPVRINLTNAVSKLNSNKQVLNGAPLGKIPRRWHNIYIQLLTDWNEQKYLLNVREKEKVVWGEHSCLKSNDVRVWCVVMLILLLGVTRANNYHR